jgi:sec-independent protein translocase protein TatB
MFDFAWSHILLLLLVAVIFLGPKELPVVLRYLGKIFAKFRQHREEIQEYVESAIAVSSEPQKTPTAEFLHTEKSTAHDAKQ